MAKRSAGSEQVLLQERGVLVSTARLVVGDRTYAVGQITSTRFVVVPGVPHDWLASAGVGAVVLNSGLIAVVMTLGGDGPGVRRMDSDAVLAIGVGVIAGAAGAVVLGRGLRLRGRLRRPPLFVAAVATSGGEVQALRDADEGFVRRVVAALSDAMIARAEPGAAGGPGG